MDIPPRYGLFDTTCRKNQIGQKHDQIVTECAAEACRRRVVRAGRFSRGLFRGVYDGPHAGRPDHAVQRINPCGHSFEEQQGEARATGFTCRTRAAGIGLHANDLGTKQLVRGYVLRRVEHGCFGGRQRFFSCRCR